MDGKESTKKDENRTVNQNLDDKWCNIGVSYGGGHGLNGKLLY